MSLKCLKRRKVMESGVSTPARNDKGFQHKPKATLSNNLRMYFFILVKQPRDYLKPFSFLDQDIEYFDRLI